MVSAGSVVVLVGQTRAIVAVGRVTHAGRLRTGARRGGPLQRRRRWAAARDLLGGLDDLDEGLAVLLAHAPGGVAGAVGGLQRRSRGITVAGIAVTRPRRGAAIGIAWHLRLNLLLFVCGVDAVTIQPLTLVVVLVDSMGVRGSPREKKLQSKKDRTVYASMRFFFLQLYSVEIWVAFLLNCIVVWRAKGNKRESEAFLTFGKWEGIKISNKKNEVKRKKNYGCAPQ